MAAHTESVEPGAKTGLRQLGLVVHPSRPVDEALREIEAWSSAHGVAVGELSVPERTRPVADPIDASDCDLLLGVGGDGTALSALHAGAESSRPVLGVACGSLGVLTLVRAERVKSALEQFAEGQWSPVAVPGLEVSWGDDETRVAINDIVVIRDDPGQIVLSVTVDETLYARFAGDGVIVATALGSSAYTMAVGGPILAPGAEGMTLTPVAPHGGSIPPLVAGDSSVLSVSVEAGHVGVRYELDGRRLADAGPLLTVRHRPTYATFVRLAEDEPRLAGLRRRRLVLDSPRLDARRNQS